MKWSLDLSITSACIGTSGLYTKEVGGVSEATLLMEPQLELSVSRAKWMSCSVASSPSNRASSLMCALMTLSGVDMICMLMHDGCRKLRWLSDFRGDGIVRDTAKSSARMEYDFCDGKLACSSSLFSDGTSKRQLSSNNAGVSGTWSLDRGDNVLRGEMLDHVVTSLEGVSNLVGESSLDGESNFDGVVMLINLSPSFLGVPKDHAVLSPVIPLFSNKSDPWSRHLNISPIWESLTRLNVKLEACCSVSSSKSVLSSTEPFWETTKEDIFLFSGVEGRNSTTVCVFWWFGGWKWVILSLLACVILMSLPLLPRPVL